MAFSSAGFVSLMLIFLVAFPLCVVEGRNRLLQDNLHEESGVDTHVIPSDDAQPLIGHRTDPGNNFGAVRKLSERRRAMEASEAGKSASSDDEGEASMVSMPAPPPPSARRRFMPSHTQFVSKFPWFPFAKDSDTVSPSSGTPSPGHN